MRTTTLCYNTCIIIPHNGILKLQTTNTTTTRFHEVSFIIKFYFNIFFCTFVSMLVRICQKPHFYVKIMFKASIFTMHFMLKMQTYFLSTFVFCLSIRSIYFMIAIIITLLAAIIYAIQKNLCWLLCMHYQTTILIYGCGRALTQREKMIIILELIRFVSILHKNHF